MKKIFTFLGLTLMFLTANADITDVISASTMTISETYEQVEVTFNSDAVYLITLKDDGNGPQFKAGSSGIVTKATGGLVKRVEVAWGSKSNEDILVYGQNTPYNASNTVIEGTLLGTVEFSAGITTGIDIEGDWEFIGITTTTKKGKAAQFGSISITWGTPETHPNEPCEGVIINEVCGGDGTNDGHEDWIELYNPTDGALDLSGVKVVKTDEDGITAELCTIAEGTTLEPGAFYIIEKGTDFTSGLSNNKNLTITLYSPLDYRLDMFDKVAALTHNGSHPEGGSYSYDENNKKWVSTSVSTKGRENICYPEVIYEYKTFVPVTAATITDGMEVILVNKEHAFAMSYCWDKTKDGGIYLKAFSYATEQPTDDSEGKISIEVANNPLAFVKLGDGGDGTWSLKFIDTNNYLNDNRFMACKEFKNIDFKKNDDPTKGTRAAITFNEGGDAEISYGEGGVIKFNYKDDTTSRFFNYDPNDKPDEHLAVYLYTVDSGSSISGIAVDSNAAAPVYYNMQGIRVDNPTKGMYIRTTGTHTEKVVIR